jgi:hypothetical protein
MSKQLDSYRAGGVTRDRRHTEKRKIPLYLNPDPPFKSKFHQQAKPPQVMYHRQKNINTNHPQAPLKETKK